MTYHCEIVKKDGRITFSVDGRQFHDTVDPNLLAEGLTGLRTFRIYLWWDNIRVTALD